MLDAQSCMHVHCCFCQNTLRRLSIPLRYFAEFLKCKFSMLKIFQQVAIVTGQLHKFLTQGLILGQAGCQLQESTHFEQMVSAAHTDIFTMHSTSCC